MAEPDCVKQFLTEKSAETFGGIMDEYTDMLRQVVYRVVLNEHDTDDVVQETFISAYQNIDSFKGKAKFSTWLCRIAFNKAYTALRKRSKTDGFELIDNCDYASSKKEGPTASMKTKEACDEILQAIKKLPDYLRMTMSLIILDEREISEAAYIMEIPTATAYWRLHKARKMLKKELGHML